MCGPFLLRWPVASQIDIINLAIYKLAQSISIPSLADESKAADIFNRLWGTAVDTVLTDRTWPWALKSQELALVVEAPQPGWRFRYSYPNDCLTAKAVTDETGLGAMRSLTAFCDPNRASLGLTAWMFEWQTSYGEQGTTINTNTENAHLVYVVRVQDPGRFPAAFVNALACRLAYEAAPPMIGDVGLNAQPRLLDAYNNALTIAGAHSYGEGNESGAYVTPAIAARGGY